MDYDKIFNKSFMLFFLLVMSLLFAFDSTIMCAMTHIRSMLMLSVQWSVLAYGT